MGCRICVEAPLEAMPLDLAVVLRSSPYASSTFTTSVVSLPLVEYRNMILTDQLSSHGCRRVATFPPDNCHYRLGKLSSLKYKWASESNAIYDSEFGQELLYPLLDSNDNNKTEQNTSLPATDWVSCIPVPVRGDLVRSTSDDVSTSALSTDQSELTSIIKVKKRVVFADDRGLELTSIKIMTEASDVPPKINYKAIMRQLFGEGWVDDEAVAKPCATWLVNFKQPASDYLAFRQKMDKNLVALENVLVRNDSCRLIGTVKVKNISFEKHVFVRFTNNDWKSYYDKECRYLPMKGSTANDTYDTFQFDFEVPCDDNKHQKMEFCVCYRTGEGNEYWDNNEGKNFEIIGEKLRLQRTQMPAPNWNGNSAEKELDSEGALACAGAWTDEFASWNTSSCLGGPYW